MAYYNLKPAVVNHEGFFGHYKLKQFWTECKRWMFK